jgi:hypothetical protein
LQRLGESGSRTDPIPSSVAFRYFVSPGHFALAFNHALRRRCRSRRFSTVPFSMPSRPHPGILALSLRRQTFLGRVVLRRPPASDRFFVYVTARMRLATELEGERAELVRAVIAPSAGSVMPLSRPASPGGALEIEPAALLPVSIDRRTVSPTTRPAPASRMHGWPAVADLTSDRPIRIALVQVGAAPKAPAHFKLSQQISQRSDPFLGSLKPRGAQIA